jgi:D-arabinose 1-dehydrogenase
LADLDGTAGKALSTPLSTTGQPFPRSQCKIVTKVGRISASHFDYTPAWIRTSIAQSLARLRTTYVDVALCHDVEFVTPAEVLTAVRELRRIRDDHRTVRYIGLSGYPIDVICRLAELILAETGEPLDCVMNYANYSLQNTRLLTEGLDRLERARVDVVVNASILGMGLLRRGGVPIGASGDWHPAPDALRESVFQASDWCDYQGEKIEVVAIRWALESWLEVGARCGSRGDRADGQISNDTLSGTDDPSSGISTAPRLGVTVIGVSSLPELLETMTTWRSILDGREDAPVRPSSATTPGVGREWSLKRREEIMLLATGIWRELGSYKDFEWESPGADYVRKYSAAI